MTDDDLMVREVSYADAPPRLFAPARAAVVVDVPPKMGHRARRRLTVRRTHQRRPEAPVGWVGPMPKPGRSLPALRRGRIRRTAVRVDVLPVVQLREARGLQSARWSHGAGVAPSTVEWPHLAADVRVSRLDDVPPTASSSLPLPSTRSRRADAAAAVQGCQTHALVTEQPARAPGRRSRPSATVRGHAAA